VPGLHDTTASPLLGPAVAVTANLGVTVPDGLDASDVLPFESVAVTVNVYAFPSVSPVTVMLPDAAPLRVPMIPSGADVAVYLVIVDPALASGASNVTTAVNKPASVVGPAIAVTCNGGFDPEMVVTGPDAADATEVPDEFFAVTVNV
jgi:hypothetical protein